MHAIRLACLTPLGLVLEAPVGEEHLLARGKYEFCSALTALQDFIVVFHVPLRDLLRRGSAAVQPEPDEGEYPRTTPWVSPFGWHKVVWIDLSGMVA